MAFLVLGANSVSGYTVKNSLRFNSGSSDYLNRTMTTPTNNKIYTWSGWIKKTTIGESAPNIFGAHSGGFRDCIRFDGGGNALQMIFNEAGSGNLVTTQLLRDVSAWYHIVVAVDTTQATSTNRVKIYLNGNQITSFSTSSYPAQNYTNIINGANVHVFGKNANLSNEFFNGYISETYFIDGQQLDATSFGQTDTDTGIWIPKAYTGTYGTNGFYLKFANSASLGTDSSGNGNTFTVNNLTSIDQTTDTPTNNFATINALENTNSSFTLTEGNLKWVSTGASYSFLRSTIGISQGKWYYEAKCTAQTNTQNKWIFGISDSPSTSSTNYIGANSYQYGWRGNSNEIFYNGTSTTYGSANSMTTGDIIGVAVDLDNNKIYWSKNGTFLNSANPATNTNGFSITGASSTNTGYYHFAFGELEGTYDYTSEINFGNPSYSANSYTDGAGRGNFSYAVPSGYFALCTANLSLYG